jgi:Lipopolysaccharide-assembly
MKMKILFSVFIVMFAGFCISGCGYTTASLLPPDQDSIFVDNFTNEIDPSQEISNRRSSYSYRPGMENEITRAVIDAFIFDRQLEVYSKDNAVLLLKGSLIDFRQFPLSYNDDDNVDEFRMEIYVDLELYDNRTNTLVWAENRFMGTTSYAISGPNRKTDAQAVKDAVNDIAKRILERTVETW